MIPPIELDQLRKKMKVKSTCVGGLEYLIFDSFNKPIIFKMILNPFFSRNILL